MSIYGALSNDYANIKARAMAMPPEPEDNSPGIFDGAAMAPVTGVVSAGAGLGLLVGQVLDGIADVGLIDAGIDPATVEGNHAGKIIDGLLNSGETAQEWLEGRKRNFTRAAIESRPSPKTTGFVGQFIHGAFEVIPQYVLGSIAAGPAGGAALVGSSMGNKKYMEMRNEEEVDYGTALATGAIEGVSQAVGAAMPMSVGPSLLTGMSLGKKIGLNAAFGGASNTVFGITSRSAFSEVLKANGHDDLAAQYEPIESASVLADLLIGSAFGVFGAVGPDAMKIHRREQADIKLAKAIEEYRANGADVDAALVAKETAFREIETSPGIPQDPAARQAHNEALDEATAALMNDEPYTARPEHTDADFAPDPAREQARAEIEATIKEELGPLPKEQPHGKEGQGRVGEGLLEETPIPKDYPELEGITFLNEDGSTRPLGEALQAADEGIIEANKQASIFELAAECAMMG